MKGATHFIEIWTSGTRYCEPSLPRPICLLGMDLKDTLEYGFKTIAVWRIKPKTILITGEEINGQSVLIAEKI